MQAGDSVRVGTPGGGYGDPRQRDPEAVREDVRLGYYTAEQARALFGLKIAEGPDRPDQSTTGTPVSSP